MPGWPGAGQPGDRAADSRCGDGRPGQGRRHRGNLRRLCRRPLPRSRAGDATSIPSIATDEKRVFLPPKEDTYGNIEGLMQQFKLVMFGHGVRPPEGEVYFPVEGANGELGFYVVSDGAANAYRVRVRPPCFAIMSAPCLNS